MAAAVAASGSLSSPSLDSLASSNGSGSGSGSGSTSKESRFNRLLTRLNSRSPSPAASSASAAMDPSPSTPLRYAPGAMAAMAVSPAMSDSEEMVLRPPVFESRFMRELEMGSSGASASTADQAVTITGAAPVTSLSPRPTLAPSYSSPAAVQQHQQHSPATLSNNSGGSLKSRLVRVASSSSLFGKSLQNQNTGHVTLNNAPASPSMGDHGSSPLGAAIGHRKTTSLAAGSTPSPRARLAASINVNGDGRNGQGHKYRHSEDVRHLYLPTNTAEDEQPPLSPRLRSILGNKDGNAIASNGQWQKSKESLLSLGSLGRKRSMDGLSTINATSPIQEEEEAPESKPATTTEDRPPLGARLYSHDRPADSTTTSTAASYALKSTPAFPRVPLNPPSTTLSASTTTHTGISSGLSESSRRFRSAFRLNKTRATPGGPGAGGDAPGTGGLSVRRALRVPLSQQQQEEDEREEEERSNAMLSRADASEASTSATEKSPDDAQSSMRSTSTGLSSLHTASPPLLTTTKGLDQDRDLAHERAQLVPSLPAVSETESAPSRSAIHQRSVSAQPLGLGASLIARRAAVTAVSASPEPEPHVEEERYDARHSSARNSPDLREQQQQGRDLRESQHARSASQAKHTRSTSARAKLDDLMLVPDVSSSTERNERRGGSPRLASSQQISSMPRSESLQSVGSEPDSDTLRAMEQRCPASRQALSRKEESEEAMEMLMHTDRDKENAAPSQSEREKGRMPIFADENMLDKENAQGGRNSPPMLGKKREEVRPVLGEVRKPLQPAQSLPQQSSQQQQPRLGKLSSSSSNGGLGYHPNDRQVLINDYAVPTKRSGDTPPDSHAPYYPHHHLQQQQQQNGYPQQQYQQHQFPSMQPTRSAPALPPPTSSLPPLPNALDQQKMQMMQQQQQPQPLPQKRPTGTVTVKGKTYTRMGLLGRGGSSKVFRVRDTEHNVYALKKVDLGRGADGETYQSFLNEIELLERLRGHDRIIQLVSSEVNEVRRSLIMVMEIGEIDLNALLQERSGKRVSMNFVRHTWEQMLEAVAVIHEEGIVHTDLKPANFVLVKGALKLIDFGIAKAIPNDTTNIARDQQIGTANYMSPEALSPHVSNGPRGERVMKLGRPSDVWSLGCILYQIVYGHTPFGRIKNLAAKMAAIQTPSHAIDFPSHSVPCTLKGEPLPDLAVKVEDDLLKCMRACLRFEPKRRATLAELLEDPFLRREGPMQQIVPAEASVGPDLMGAIVGKTLQWSQGRMPSRGEQERFVDALVRQLQQAQAGQR